MTQLVQALIWRYHEYPAENAPPYPPDMPLKMLVYHWYSKVKGWPEKVVDELSLESLEWYPLMEAASGEVADIIAKEMRAQRN